MAIFLLFALLGGFIFWSQRMQAKEHALHLATDASLKHGYQLLDESIGIIKTRIGRKDKKFCVTRAFEFYYANHEQQRHRGTITQQGKTWSVVKFDTVLTNLVPSNIALDRKIIPFPGKYKP